MTRIIVSTLVLSLIVLACNNNTAEKTSSVTEDDKQKLTYLKEVEWPKAYREQDTVLLDRILNDDFEMVRADGEWSNKAKELEWIKNNAFANDSFYYEIKRLSIYENGTAIVAGQGHVFNDGKETVYESSNVLIKKDSLWKAITSHVSGIRDIDN